MPLRSAGEPSPRIAIVGFSIECNRFSPVTTGEQFALRADIRGEEIVRQAREGPCRVSADLPGFFARMDATGPWTPVPLRIATAQPGGPAEQRFVDELFDEIDAGLAAAAPLDGVFIVAHGAALSTESDDPDGDLYERIRKRVGPEVPIVAVFDLHANVSRRMTENLDVFVGYLENPHTDCRERGEEAARHLRELLAGGTAVVEMVKLPLTPPSITLLTAAGPYAEMIDYGQTKLGGDIMNVSVMAGFVFSDCPKNGYTAVVTARNRNRRAAFELARDICARTWAMRERFERPMTDLADAVALAVAAGADDSLAPLLLADVADNPGGGGRGNTTSLLKALVDANAHGVVLGVFNDAALAEQAHEAGLGAHFEAVFNRTETDAFSARFVARVTVVSLSDGEIVGRRGMMKGLQSSMGRSARLRIDSRSEAAAAGSPSAAATRPEASGDGRVSGVEIVVISNRQQCLDPMQLESLGVDLGAVRTLVVKSRGHFRAGFDEFCPPERILEVDCPGLTSPALHRFDWTRLPRPVFPLDKEAAWVPPESWPLDPDGDRASSIQ